MIASRQGNTAEVQRVGLILNGLDTDAAETLRKATTLSNEAALACSICRVIVAGSSSAGRQARDSISVTAARCISSR